MVSVYDQRDARTLRFIVYTTSLDGANQYVFYGGAPGGGAGDLSGVNWQFDVDRVPTATFRVRNPQLTGIGYRSPVEIRASFQGLPTIVFRGVVLDWARDAEGITYQCVGRSWSLDVPYQEVLGIFQGPITSQQAVLNMLGNAGLTAYSTVSLPAWTIGSVARQTLSFGTWGDAIRKVIEVEDAHWWEDRVGNVHVSNLALVPAPTSVRTYYAALTPVALVEQTPAGVTAGYRPRIRSGQNQTEVRAVKNRILVRGASLSTTGADGTATTANIEANASAPSPYVVKPDGTQDYSDFVFSNELIDTQVKADEVALRYLTKLNRLENRYTVVIDGDPRVQLGETVKIIDYDYLGIVGNFVVQGYQTQMDESDFVTTLQLTAGGLSVNQDPVAAFQYTVDREVFNDRVYAIVTFDARDSYDLDGTIASYSWTDNQTPDIATGTAPVFTVKVDPATLSPAAWTVTLVVTDNAGSTDTFTLTVDIGPDADFVFTPAFTAALDTRFSATPDGGQNWRDQVGTSVISTACGDMSLAPGIAVYGTTPGGIWRTTDYCFTAPTQVMANAGNPMVDLEWDRYRPNLVWGVTQSGRVYRSNDAGVTWALWDSLSTVFASTNIRLNRVHSIPTGVRVYGALNGVPLIASDKLLGHVWTRAAIGGELAADLDAGSPSDIYVADAAWQEDDKVAIILNHSGGLGVGGLAFKAGTYTGNGGDLSIGGLGFTPKLVFVHGDPDTTATSTNGLMRTTTMSAARNVQNGTDNQGISSLDSDGFTVHHDGTYANGHTNESGVTYFYLAFGGASCDVGSYVGTGAVHSVTGVGFRPEVAGMLSLDQNSSMAYRTTTQLPGARDLQNSAAFGETDRILSLDADGFTLGVDLSDDVNNLGWTYHYWAFKAAGNLAVGKYTGAYPNPQTVPSVPFGFTPDLVWIKNPDVGWEAIWKSSDMTAGDSLIWSTGPTQTKEIQALSFGQFVVGVVGFIGPRSNNAPANGDHHFFAVQESSGASSPLPTVYYTEDVDGDGSAWTRAANQPTDKTRGRYITEDLESGKYVFAYNDRVNYRGDVSAGIMSVTAAVAQLDVGDAPNHGLFVGQRLQGMAGVYVVSAEGTADGTLYKTFDRFATIGKLRPATGYPAMPAGANAKMADLGRSLAPQGLNLYVQQGNISTTTYPRRVARLSDGGWVLVSNPGSVSQFPCGQLRKHGANWYRWAGNFVSNNFGDSEAQGRNQRSTDGGVTWTDIGEARYESGSRRWGAGWSGVKKSADGVLWMIYSPNALETDDKSRTPLAYPTLYKSTDDGATWAVAYQYTILDSLGRLQFFLDLFVHPSDSSKIGIVGTETFGNLEIHWSSNGGASFTKIAYGSLGSLCDGGSAALGARRAVCLSDGSVVTNARGQFYRVPSWGYNGSCVPFLSDVGSGASFSLQLVRTASDVLFFCGTTLTTTSIWRSFDGGVSWGLVHTSPGGMVDFIHGFVYDDANDALYWVTRENDATGRVYRMADATKPTIGAVVDITLNLDDLFTGGAGDSQIGIWGVAIG